MMASRLKHVISKLPKSELHLHLDGSLSCSFILETAKKKGILFPDPDDPDKLLDLLMREKAAQRANHPSVLEPYILPKYKSSSNWKIFDFCNQFLQSKEELFTATKQLVIDLAINHNVRIIEIRFCPTLHVLDGLSESKVVESVLSGYQSGVQCVYDRTGIEFKGGIILCVLRSFEPSHWFKMLDLTEQYLDEGIVAMDIAGNEAGFPLKIFEGGSNGDIDDSQNLLQQCNERGIPLTVHAGEFPVIPATNQNIEIALRYKAIKRIGHGLTLQFDHDLMRKVQSAGVGVECCLTSNIGGGKKCKNYKVHPIKMMREFGIKCCLNSDNILLSGDERFRPNPSHEIEKYVTELNADWSEVKAVLMNAATMSYDKTIDEKWLRKFEKAIDDAISEEKVSTTVYGRKLKGINHLF